MNLHWWRIGIVSISLFFFASLPAAGQTKYETVAWDFTAGGVSSAKSFTLNGSVAKAEPVPLTGGVYVLIGTLWTDDRPEMVSNHHIFCPVIRK